MAKLLILGGGVSGQTAAMHAKSKLGNKHEVIVVTPNSNWNWIPSNIWVGVGFMKKSDVIFPLAPVYKKKNITYHQAKAVSIHPEGNANSSMPYVTIEYTSPEKAGETADVQYDYLINATGPKLKFEATEGLGPDHNSHSVCTASHAEDASAALMEVIAAMKKGDKKDIVIGTGHGTCTCQGAAFEYIFNVEYLLRKHNVRDKANLIWFSNEAELGDFGMGGMFMKRGGYVTHSRVFTESLYAERNISWITKAHVNKVEKDTIHYETLDGKQESQHFDFAMLLPPFSGVPMKAYNKSENDISSEVFAPNGFMKVDADYSKKEYEDWSPDDWPRTYQSPKYDNIYAIGIAFAPPHAISKPMFSPNDTPIFPTPPRTGMPSGVMAREVAFNVVDRMNGHEEKATRTASMSKMGAACIASAGAGFLSGTAASMTMYPIIPDFKTYPDTGRSLSYTSGEIGLAGHWIKHFLHFAFIYKAKANPFWRVVPE